MIDESRYPQLFGGPWRVEWAPLEIRFELLRGPIDQSLLSAARAVCFVAGSCVVVGFANGDWTPVPGGTIEPGETWPQTLERELLEEAGARLIDFTPFGLLHFLSEGPPWRPHLPHPRFAHLIGFAEVQLVCPPTCPPDGEHTICVDTMPPTEAAEFLATRGDHASAELCRLAAELRTMHH